MKMNRPVVLLLCLAFLGQHTAVEPTGHHDHGSVVVEEGSDVVLPCSLAADFKVFDWKKDGRREAFLYDAGSHYNNGRPGQDEQFKGRVSHFEDEVRYGNASIKITNAKLDDSGDYTCFFPNLQPHHEFHVQLVVRPVCRDRSGEVRGASPEPHITIHDVRDDSVLLQCEVRLASPQPKLHWQDGDGNVLRAEEPQVSERGGRYNITLRALVTRANCYRCGLTQEAIHHVTDAEITLPAKLFVQQTCSKRDVAGWIVGFCLGGLTLGVTLVCLVAGKVITIHRNNGPCRDNRDNGL